MSYIYIIPSYLVWHYSEAFKDILRVWTNILWFLYNFFSITLLLKTLFAPWRRIHDERKRGKIDFENIAEIIVANTVMRLVGFVVRISVILIGTVTVVVFFWLGAVFFLLWILMPVVIPTSFFFGLSSLFGMI